MRARVFVSLKPQVLDPQGKAVMSGLNSMGYQEVQEVRMGKCIEITLSDDLPLEEAKKRLDEMCHRLLANTVIEDYKIELK